MILSQYFAGLNGLLVCLSRLISVSDAWNQSE
jgi:hypothetical protein